MKYKVGDKVKIKENLIVGKTYGGLYCMMVLGDILEKKR